MLGYLLLSYFLWVNNSLEIYVSKLIISVISFIVDHIVVEGLLGLTACLFGLLVPVAILLIENNGNKRDKSFTWDKMVLFSKVVNINFVVLGFFFLTIPLIFWSESTIRIFKILWFCLYFSGFVLVSISLKQCYEWIISKNKDNKNFRTKKREEFIKDLANKDFDLKIEVWGLIWKSEDERIGLNDQYLFSEYIKQYFTLTNNKNRISFLELYFGKKFSLTYENNQEIKNLLYEEIIRVYFEDDKNQDFYLFKNKLLSIFNAYLKEYLDDQGPYFYGLKEWLDKLLKDLGDKYDEFLNQNGLSLLGIVRKKVENYDVYELEKILPDSLIYDKVTSDKQMVITRLYFKWLDESNALNFKKSAKEKLFAQSLLEFMFLKMEPITFFRIISFSIFIKDYSSDEKNLENAISRYAHEPNNGLGISRLSGDVSFGGNMETFNKKLEEDQKWTYNYIYDLGYPYLNDKNYLDTVIKALNAVVLKNDHISEVGIIYLKGIIIELEQYKKSIYG